MCKSSEILAFGYSKIRTYIKLCTYVCMYVHTYACKLFKDYIAFFPLLRVFFRFKLIILSKAVLALAVAVHS